MIKVIVSIVVILLLAGSFTYVYLYYEKPSQENTLVFSNLTISMKDVNNDYIITGYKIKSILHDSQGVTSDRGSIITTVPYNSSIEIYNQNINEQNFYIDYRIEEITENVERIDFNQVIPGSIVAFTENDLKDDKIFVNASISGIIKNLVICIEWSSHFYDGEILSQNFTGGDKLRKTDRCVYSNQNFEDERLGFEIKPTQWGNLGISDSIKVYFIDGDLINGTINYDENKFAKDYMLTIR